MSKNLNSLDARELFSEFYNSLYDGSGIDYIKEILEVYSKTKQIGASSNDVHGKFNHYAVNIVGDILNVIAVIQGLEVDPNINRIHANPALSYKGHAANFFGIALEKTMDKEKLQRLANKAKEIFGLVYHDILDKPPFYGCEIKFSKRDVNFVQFWLPFTLDDKGTQPKQLKFDSETHEPVGYGEYNNSYYEVPYVKTGLDRACSLYHDVKFVVPALCDMIQSFLNHPECDKILDTYIDLLSQNKMQSIATKTLKFNPDRVPNKSSNVSTYAAKKDENSDITLHEIRLSDSARDKLQNVLDELIHNNISAYYKKGTSLFIGDNEAQRISDIINEEVGCNIGNIIKDTSIDPTQALKIKNLPIGFDLNDFYDARIKKNKNLIPNNETPYGELVMSALYKSAGMVVDTILNDNGVQPISKVWSDPDKRKEASSKGLDSIFDFHQDGAFSNHPSESLALFCKYGNKQAETGLANVGKAFRCLINQEQKILTNTELFSHVSGKTSIGKRISNKGAIITIGKKITLSDGKELEPIKFRANFAEGRMEIHPSDQFSQEDIEEALKNFKRKLVEFSIGIPTETGDLIFINNTAHGRNPHKTTGAKGYRELARANASSVELAEKRANSYIKQDFTDAMEFLEPTVVR